MIIKYKNKIIQNGQFLTPKEASVKPNVTYKANPKYLYTFMLHDPKAFGGNHLHWVVINIPGDNINNGVQLLSYNKPHPHEKSGMHPYIFKVFKQKHKITERLTFHRTMSRKDILNQFGDVIGTPLEICYFYSEFQNKKTNKNNKNNKTISRIINAANKTRKRYNFMQFN